MNAWVSLSQEPEELSRSARSGAFMARRAAPPTPAGAEAAVCAKLGLKPSLGLASCA